ncbi:hypothetical protein SB5439_05121 [Klebsiella variicola]|uniref:DUF2800 domain-containing protein n=1 Tax=Klebsiella variicola TaxID=244366 RepID=UPI00109D4B66|nr:DUF2800 domain-containing protein [Klebsiella variicola]VGQ12971.1 hypothetical protein SB5439_05121 [Klebsiella variicola]
MPEAHARLSPSGAEKWMVCPASLAAERGIPEVRSNHAAQGTAAHAVAEQVLNAVNPRWKDKRPAFHKLAASEYVGETVENWLITDDMIDPIQTYIDTVLVEAQGKTLHVEQRVDFSHIVGVRNSFGTADAIVINGDELQIHDLKFGQGVKVDAENNKQLQIYALGALRMFDLGNEFNTVRLFIHQPRLNHVSEWALSVRDLKKFGREVKAAATRAIKIFDLSCAGEPPSPEDFSPSVKGCRWCKAAPTCKAYAKRVYSTVANEFQDLDAALSPSDPTRLTDLELAKAHCELSMIEAWCDKVKREVANKLLAGGALPGLKVVRGKSGPRKWSNTEDVEATICSRFEDFGRFYSKPVLLSPTQAEKLLKTNPERWELLTPYIQRSPGSPTIVTESDPRPALDLNPANDFDVIN